MCIKSILTLFNGANSEIPTLESSFEIGRKFKAHVKCFHISPDIKSRVNYIGAGMPVYYYDDLHESIEEDIKSRTKEAHEKFKECIEKNNVCFEGASSHCEPHTSWNHKTGFIDEIIAEEGRLSDLIILTHDLTKKDSDYKDSITSSLFNTGCPVLFVPNKEQKNTGENVAIAWDGSIQASKVVKSAISFLKEAKNVMIFTVDEDKNDNPSSKDLATYLKEHDIKSEHIPIKNRKFSTGEAILGESANQKTDLLIMGAYHHTRVREMILGGVTKHMLDNAFLPILMMH